MASAHEARTIAVLEAMACGCAVVLSDIPPFQELIRDCGEVALQFPVGDARALADAITAAYADRATLGPKAREAAVEHLSSEAFGQRLATLLDEAASTGRHA
jgi:glycosyltransferase involved in cell wall biosynthesis